MGGETFPYGCCVRTEGCAQADIGPKHFIGERRLRAWEAVVFGALHVEIALAIALGARFLALRGVVTKTSVVMLVRLECVLKTLHPSNGRLTSHL